MFLRLTRFFTVHKDFFAQTLRIEHGVVTEGLTCHKITFHLKETRLGDEITPHKILGSTYCTVKKLSLFPAIFVITRVGIEFKIVYENKNFLSGGDDL